MPDSMRLPWQWQDAAVRRLTTGVENGLHRPDLQLKAAQDLKKMAGILPGHITNQKITNIVNQQNNIITPETMEIAKKLLPGLHDE